MCISTPPTGLDECVFFNSLVVRLPHSLIFWQFWLFFVFKLLLSFFWLCKEAYIVCLPMPPSWPEVLSFPFDWKLFLVSPFQVTLVFCFFFSCLLDLSAFTPCLHGVIFFGTRPVGLSDAISFISGTWCSCAALYAFYVVVVGFWLLLSRCFVGSSLWLTDWESLHPPRFVHCYTGTARTKPK